MNSIVFHLPNSVISGDQVSDYSCKWFVLFLQPNPRDYMDDYHVSGFFIISNT